MIGTLAVLVSILLTPAAAQNTTTVSGTVKDANGVPYSNGTVQAQLLPTGVTPTIPPPCNGQNSTPCVVSAFQRGSTDVGGNFNMNLASNAVLSPGGTTWQFTVNTAGAPPPLGTGPQSCSATVSISGASQSITTNFSGCPALSNVAAGSGGGGLGSPALPAIPNLIAENLFNDGSGTVMSDASGNGNTCTLGAAGAAPTVNPVAAGGGLTFATASSQFCAFPASVNQGKTFMLALSFQQGLTPLPANEFTGAYFNSLIAGSAPVANSLNWMLYQNYTTDTWSPGTQGNSSFRTLSTVNNTFNSSSACNFLGTGVVALTLSAPDTFYINGQPCVIRLSGSSIGQQTAGVLQLGGSSTASPFGVPAQFLQGTVYCDAIWNIALSPAQIALASQALQSACLTQRGITPQLGGATSIVPANSDCHPSNVVDGDSIFAGINVPAQGLAGQPASTSDTAISATGTFGVLNRFALNDAPLFRPCALTNTFVEWAGTNDLSVAPVVVAGNIAGTMRLAEQTGFRSVAATMISRSGQEVFRDNLNPFIRQYVPLASSYNGMLDLGANTHLGCDGCNANTTYFNVDGVHITTFAAINIVGPYYVFAINRANGSKLTAGNYNIYTGTGLTIPTLLQSKDCPALSGASVVCLLPWPLSTGSLVTETVNCVICTGVTINVPTDSQGLAYAALAATGTYNAGSLLRAFAAPNSAAAVDTLTQTFTGGAPTNINITVQEWGGVATAAPLDVAGAIATGTSATPTTAAITTTLAGDLLFGYQSVFATNASPAFTPYGTFFQPTAPLVLANDAIPVAGMGTVTGAAGSYTTSSTISQPAGMAWGAGAAAFKAVAGTSTYQLQGVDVKAACLPNGANNVGLILPDGTPMTGGTITLTNLQTAGAATCTALAPTPYATGVTQTLNGSGVIANNTTAVFQSTYSFTGTPGSSLVPVITWTRIQ